MAPLEGGFVLEQVSCPSCAVVLNTEVEEVEVIARTPSP
jgi:hypothetical protein